MQNIRFKLTMRMDKPYKIIGASLVGFLVLSCALAWSFGIKQHASNASGAFNLIILHTNDIHAHDIPYIDRGKLIGGVAKIGELIESIKKEHDNVLVVDAGDFFQGTPMFQRYGGDVEIELLNKIGYDIVELGNHEFDRGAIYLAKHLQQAKFPVLACNLDCSQLPALQHIVKPSLVKEVHGEKIAFIGVITPDLAQKALNLNGVKIIAPDGNWLAPVDEQIAYYQSLGINKIIVVSHCGVELDKELAEKCPAVDIIIGGHSHTRLSKPIWVEHPDGTSTAIVQTGCYGRALGEMEIAFNQQGNVLPPETKYHLINIINDNVQADPQLDAYLTEKEKPLLALQKEIVGYSGGTFDNCFNIMSLDSAIGDLICDALAESGKDYGVQISFQNRGGIRCKIEKGPISEEKVQETLPFDNKVVYATISGDILLSILKHSLAGPLHGSFLDVHGLKIGYDKERQPDKRLVYAFTWDESGQWLPVKRQALYKIAVNDYTFKGGEGYDFSGAANVQYSDKDLVSVLHDYLLKHKYIKPHYGNRIILIDKPHTRGRRPFSPNGENGLRFHIQKIVR